MVWLQTHTARVLVISFLFSYTRAGTVWIYFRDTFMALSYLYGKKFVATPTPLILQLRQELYPQTYADIVWSQARNRCAKVKV